MTRIFLTGATGYIGGDLLHLLVKSHPEYKVKALVRNAVKAESVTRAFNRVQVVHGDLDDTDVLTRESEDADIILHLAATGHLNSVQAIHRALANKSSREKPLYWVQISGGSALAAAELDDPSRPAGTASSIVWDDLGGIDAIRSLIRNHPKRAVDNHMLFAAANTPDVKTALVMPPIIYGQGRGPVNQRSVQVPELARLTLRRRRGVQVGAGESRWGNVHIRDLSQLILRLVEKAAGGSQEEDIWGPKALYLAGLGELTFGDISRRVAAAGADLKLLSDTSIKEINGAEADQLLPHGTVLYGTNARVQASRAQELLGWKGTHESLEEDIPRTVAFEARDLGLIEGTDKAPRL